MLTEQIVSLGLVALLVCQPARAADLRDVLTDYSVASWTQKDGLPSGFVWSLTQDREGYLWVGTDDGLFRFDGLRFAPWHGTRESTMPTASVRSLLTSRDGTLWVGFGGGGGIAAIRDGRVRVFGPENGAPAGAVATIVEDSAGTIWAGTGRGLYSFQANRWSLRALDPTDANKAIYSAYIDSHSRIFVATSDTIFSGDGETGFQPVKKLPHVQTQFDSPRAITENAAGDICTTDPVFGFRVIQRETARVGERERGRGSRLLRDSRGTLWVGTYGQGLWRLRHSDRSLEPPAERLSAATGLLSDGVMSLLEDRDGNIWVGTSEGLNRLTPHKVEQIVDLGLVIGIEQAEDGGLWVANIDGLIRYRDAASHRLPERSAIQSGHLRSLTANPNGGLWAATDQLVMEFGARSSRRLSLPAGAPEPIDSITSDATDGLWIHALNGSLWHWSNYRLESFALPGPLSSASVIASYTDSSGRAWFAFSGGEVGVIGPERTLHVFGAKDGVAAGEYRAIYEGSDHAIWLAGLAGLTRFSGGAFTTLSAEQLSAFGNLTAVVEDVNGGLWIGSTSGILHIAKGEFEAAVANRQRTIRYDKYDRSDGLAGVPGLYSNNRRVVRASDGRLWFVTGRGITIIDPTILTASSKPRTVHIDAVVADHKEYPSSPVELGSRALEINYGTLDLTSPLKSKFRYRLEGFEPEWIDAGSRRQAFYTNLPPGAYTFRVAASNPDGSWSESIAPWHIVIKPRFYETAWFAAFALTTLAFTLWGAWVLRLRHVRRQFAALLGERTRLSREIHDTLLQSLIGISLQFDVLGEDPGAAPQHKARLTRMRRQVETYIREARQSIWDLRSPRLQADGLVEALRRTGEEATGHTAVSFAFSVDGAPRPYAANAEEQLLRIGQEAVVNAMRHASARQISMELRYRPDVLTLRVTDDGRGFDAEAVSAHTNGHYGLVSMRERAELAGGAIEIVSAIGGGTQIQASIPHVGS